MSLSRRFAAGYEVYKDAPPVQKLVTQVAEYNTLLRHMDLKDHQVGQPFPLQRVRKLTVGVHVDQAPSTTDVAIARPSPMARVPLARLEHVRPARRNPQRAHLHRRWSDLEAKSTRSVNPY